MIIEENPSTIAQCMTLWQTCTLFVILILIEIGWTEGKEEIGSSDTCRGNGGLGMIYSGRLNSNGGVLFHF